MGAAICVPPNAVLRDSALISLKAEGEDQLQLLPEKWMAVTAPVNFAPSIELQQTAVIALAHNAVSPSNLKAFKLEASSWDPGTEKEDLEFELKEEILDLQAKHERVLKALEAELKSQDMDGVLDDEEMEYIEDALEEQRDEQKLEKKKTLARQEVDRAVVAKRHAYEKEYFVPVLEWHEICSLRITVGKAHVDIATDHLTSVVAAVPRAASKQRARFMAFSKQLAGGRSSIVVWVCPERPDCINSVTEWAKDEDMELCGQSGKTIIGKTINVHVGQVCGCTITPRGGVKTSGGSGGVNTSGGSGGSGAQEISLLWEGSGVQQQYSKPVLINTRLLTATRSNGGSSYSLDVHCKLEAKGEEAEEVKFVLKIAAAGGDGEGDKELAQLTSAFGKLTQAEDDQRHEEREQEGNVPSRKWEFIIDDPCFPVYTQPFGSDEAASAAVTTVDAALFRYTGVAITELDRCTDRSGRLWLSVRYCWRTTGTQEGWVCVPVIPKRFGNNSAVMGTSRMGRITPPIFGSNGPNGPSMLNGPTRGGPQAQSCDALQLRAEFRPGEMANGKLAGRAWPLQRAKTSSKQQQARSKYCMYDIRDNHGGGGKPVSVGSSLPSLRGGLLEFGQRPKTSPAVLGGGGSGGSGRSKAKHRTPTLLDRAVARANALVEEQQFQTGQLLAREQAAECARIEAARQDRVVEAAVRAMEAEERRRQRQQIDDEKHRKTLRKRQADNAGRVGPWKEEQRRADQELQRKQAADAEDARAARAEYERRRDENAMVKAAADRAEYVLRAGGTHKYGTTSFKTGGWFAVTKDERAYADVESGQQREKADANTQAIRAADEAASAKSKRRKSNAKKKRGVEMKDESVMRPQWIRRYDADAEREHKEADLERFERKEVKRPRRNKTMAEWYNETREDQAARGIKAPPGSDSDSEEEDDSSDDDGDNKEQ
jgi:hypothetical protein